MYSLSDAGFWIAYSSFGDSTGGPARRESPSRGGSRSRVARCEACLAVIGVFECSSPAAWLHRRRCLVDVGVLSSGGVAEASLFLFLRK